MTELMSDNINELVIALITATSEFRSAVKDSFNPHFKSKFVSLAGVNAATQDALLKYGLILTQPLKVVDGDNVLVSLLLHTSGQWIKSEYKLRPVKADPQGDGSALTYARRYAAMALLGIAPGDDDGESATRPRKQVEADPEGPNAQDWLAFIAGASTPDELNEIGKRLAASPLSPAVRAPLKTAWSARMNELKGAA